MASPGNPIDPETLASLRAAEYLSQQPYIDQVLGLRRVAPGAVTPDFLQKIAAESMKPKPLSKGTVAVPAATGGQMEVDLATREIYPPSVISKDKPAPGSMGTVQEFQPDGSYVLRDKATGEIVKGEKPDKPKEPTLEQRTAMGFSNRIKLAEKEIGTIDDFDPSSTFLVPMPSRIKSAGRQRYEAAAGNWIAAVLRKESGAAISPSEYETAYKQYFPLPGDDKSVVEQKARLRGQVQSDFEKFAGSAVEEARGEGTPAPRAAAPSAGTVIRTDPRTGLRYEVDPVSKRVLRQVPGP